MQSAPAGDGHRSRLLTAACIVAAAFNARTIFSSGGALLPEIMAGAGLSGAVASVLAAMPIVGMGLFAPLAGWLGRQYGAERAITGGLTLLAGAIAARSLGGTALLFAGTALAGLAIAIVNVLLPVVIKRRFPDRTALMTSLYTTAIGAGAACGAAVTVPIARALGMDWRLALLCWGGPVLLALLLFLIRQRLDAKASAPPPRAGGGLWRDRNAVRMTLFFSLHSGLSYSVFGWLAPILTSRGMDPAAAGYVVALTIAGQMAGTLLAPLVASRLADPRWLNPLMAVGSAATLASFVICPLSLIPWLGPVQGLFQGAMLAISMLLIVQRSSDASVAARLSAMVQSAGMAMAALTPLLVGVLLGWTGSFHASAILFLAIGAGAAVAGYGAGLPGVIGSMDEKG